MERIITATGIAPEFYRTSLLMGHTCPVEPNRMGGEGVSLMSNSPNFTSKVFHLSMFFIPEYPQDAPEVPGYKPVWMEVFSIVIAVLSI